MKIETSEEDFNRIIIALEDQSQQYGQWSKESFTEREQDYWAKEAEKSIQLRNNLVERSNHR